MPSDSIPPTSTSTPTMRRLASAVNAPTGWPNATVTGQPNDIFDIRTTFKLAMARKCWQYLPRSPNATASGLLNDISKYTASNFLDLTMRGKCINAFLSWPNATANGHLNDPFGIVSSIARCLASGVNDFELSSV
ncbi:hypothetical protein K523DRAFT_348869 [Schizophyllum commune Tattone D]|nr:hypothetical protein K523DRAFT_348869 [Schizophyllum commune Tattone D]